MSKGPGHVEIQLVEILRKNKKKLFSTRDLCRKVYRVEQVKKKHRVSVLRALDRMSKRSTINVWRAVLEGSRDDFWFDYDRASPNPKHRPDIAPAKDSRPLKPRKYKRPWKYKLSDKK
jgi:hypothetical protein